MGDQLKKKSGWFKLRYSLKNFKRPSTSLIQKFKPGFKVELKSKTKVSGYGKSCNNSFEMLSFTSTFWAWTCPTTRSQLLRGKASSYRLINIRYLKINITLTAKLPILEHRTKIGTPQNLWKMAFFRLLVIFFFIETISINYCVIFRVFQPRLNVPG